MPTKKPRSDKDISYAVMAMFIREVEVSGDELRELCGVNLSQDRVKKIQERIKAQVDKHTGFYSKYLEGRDIDASQLELSS